MSSQEKIDPLPGPSDEEIEKEISRHMALCGPDFPSCGIGYAMRYIFAQEANHRAPSEHENPYEINQGASNGIRGPHYWVDGPGVNILVNGRGEAGETRDALNIAYNEGRRAPSEREKAREAVLGKVSDISAYCSVRKDFTWSWVDTGLLQELLAAQEKLAALGDA